jgi:hypothetical protein
MGTQFTKRALSAKLGFGALALMAERASADTPLTSFAFPATGTPTPRTMPDRLAEITNVKDYGALGDGTTDDTVAIQAALNAAYGSPSSPNGGTEPGYYRNRPVFFPAGKYIISSPLRLRSVHGAHIFGAGRFTTTIRNAAANGSVFVTNGCQYSKFEGLNLWSNGTGVCFDLDWDGTGTAALQSVTFAEMFFSAGAYGLRIGESQAQGSEILILNCYFNAQTVAGIATKNLNAVTSVIVGGNISQCEKAIWVRGGSTPIICGVGFQLNNTIDIHIEGGAQDSYLISGCRTESINFLESQPDCMVNVVGCTQMNGSPGYFVYETGSQTNLIGCYSRNGRVHGSSKLTVQNCRFDRVDWNAWYGSVSCDLFAIKGMSLTTNHAPIAGAESGTQYDNTGATKEVGFTLPVDGSTPHRIPVGTTFSFYVTKNQTFKIIAGRGSTIRIGSSVSSAGGSASSRTVGDFLELVCLVQGGTSWGARSTIGSWMLA